MIPAPYTGSMDAFVAQRIKDGIAGIYRRAHEQHGNMTPCVEVYVDDEKVIEGDLSGSLASILLGVSIEDTVDTASVIKLTIMDDDMYHTDSDTFAKGRELSVWAGYDSSMLELLRGIIVRSTPDFSEEGTVTLEVTAYDISYKLGIEEVEAEDDSAKKKRASETGVTHSGTWAEIAAKVYGKYGVKVYASKSFMETRPSFPVIQKKGTTDAAFIRAISNLTNAEFFVSWRPTDDNGEVLSSTGRLYRLKERGLPIPAQKGRWVCYMREQPQLPEGPMYQWCWRSGDETSLMSFQPDDGPLATVTSIQVLFYDPKTKDWVTVDKNDDPAPSGYAWRKEKRLVKNWVAKDIRNSRRAMGYGMPVPDSVVDAPLTDDEIAQRENLPFHEQLHRGAFEGKDGSRERVVRKRIKTSARRGLFADAEARGGLGNEIRIVSGDTAITVKAAKRFRTASEALAYAEAFVKRHRETYWTATCELMTGLETVRAGQVHLFTGLGKKYSGAYYLAGVTHSITAESFNTSMALRRVVDTIPTLEVG